MTTKISKSLLESISNVVNSDSKNLTESYSYIDKKNNKASNTDQLEDLIAAELDLGGVDDEDLETMLNLFKKGYYIAVAVGASAKRELKKDGYTLGNFAAYKDGDERTQEIYVKAPAGMKEETEGNKLEEAKSSYRSLDKNNVSKGDYANVDKFEAFVLGELIDSPIDSDDADELFNLFKNGSSIAVEVEGQGHAKQLKADGFSKANTMIYKDESFNKNVSFWTKAPAKK